MYNQKILPFYMTYPLPLYYQEEDTATRDLEYLQQMYPAEAKRYQKMIAGILDKLDYEGSMIYDEYPDACSLRALTGSVRKVLENEEENCPTEDMIQILLCDEIYKRRHGGKRGKIF